MFGQLFDSKMTVSDTTLWREYDLLKRQFSLGEEALKDIALNAVQGAFITEGEKEKLKEQIEQNFARWLCHMK